VTEPVYRVEIAETLAGQIAEFSQADRDEVLAGLARLAKDPLPGGASRVWRIRVSGPGLQTPVFYSTTTHFGILHTLEEDRILVLDIQRRPTLRLRKR
jgi:hypothetical protein